MLTRSSYTKLPGPLPKRRRGRSFIVSLSFRASRASHSSRASGFSLIELLIVIAVILVLLSLLIVGLNQATKTAQGANTRALMSSISQSLVRFKDDVGYYPPILANPTSTAASRYDNRDLDEAPPFTDGGYVADRQSWYSITTLADYLVGYDIRRHGSGASSGGGDGYGATATAGTGEIPFTGIRHPGHDGVWGSTSRTQPAPPGFPGSYLWRNPLDPETGARARVYGPYLELGDERLLGVIVDTDEDDRPRIAFPGDAEYAQFAENWQKARVICDYWGQPIEYFRLDYPSGSLDQPYLAGIDWTRDGALDESDAPPRLSDVYHLRPYTVDPGAQTDRMSAPDASGDTTSTAALDTAEFALFSSGPDRMYDGTVRVDQAERNRDNVVITGP